MPQTHKPTNQPTNQQTIKIKFSLLIYLIGPKNELLIFFFNYFSETIKFDRFFTLLFFVIWLSKFRKKVFYSIKKNPIS